MYQIVAQDAVEKRIVRVRNMQVILDCDVADLYGVTTKQINQALSRNPEKFPNGYVITLEKQEKAEVVTICDHLEKLKFSSHLPNAFTESGLYMLATILKSPQATETSIAIIDTFTKVRAIGRSIRQISLVGDDEKKKSKLMQKTGELISDLIVPDDVDDSESEACIELNLAVVKFKYTRKKQAKSKRGRQKK